MTRKRKERKLERLVLGALILGAGTLWAPAAEAEKVIDDGTYPETVTGNGDTGSQNGNHLTINGGTFGKDIYGGYADDDSVSGNVVTINNCTQIIGGAGGFGSPQVNTNQVIINGGTFSSGNFYGGLTGGTATGNSVTIAGSNPLNLNSFNIIAGGGMTENTDNHIDINRAGVSIGSLSGYLAGSHSGNTLNLNALNTTVTGDVHNFDTIVIGCGFTKDANANAKVISGTFSDIGTLDVTGLYSAETLGTMTLLSSSSNIGVTTLKYSTGTGTTTTDD